MDELRLSDPLAQRLSRFFADLMVTLAEDGAGSAESAEAVRDLWQARTSGRGGLTLDAETVVHGIGAVALALADEVVSLRRAAGTPDATRTDVWREIVCAFEPERLDDAGSAGGGVIDLS